MIPFFNPVPFVAANLTDTELIRLIEHHYPKLQGPLQALVERLARRAGTTEERRPVPPPALSCPHCGSEFVLNDPPADSEGGLL